MRIENIRHSSESGRVRSTATVIWEDSPRDPQDFYFETPDVCANGITANPHAFLIPCTIAALRHRETRVAVDTPICPELKGGLTTAIRLLQYWWIGPPRPTVTIEAPSNGAAAPPRDSRRAAFCFTGGIDSLAVLRNNRRYFAPEHAGYLQDGVLVFGLEVEQLDAFEHVTDVLQGCASAAGVALVPVFTNIQELDKDWAFWTQEFEAAVLAGVGHALHTRIASLSIGSSFDYGDLHPHGSHPLLDPNYSSSDLQIRHDGVSLSRLEKTTLVADWPPALRALHVCNRYETYEPGLINCGTCEKCLRTLAGLLVVGAVDRAATFAQRDVTPELIDAHVHLDATSAPFWDELLPPLRQQGRRQLVSAVERAIARYRGEVGLAGAVRRLDRLHLHGSLRSMKRTITRTARRLLPGTVGVFSGAAEWASRGTVAELLQCATLCA